MKKNERFFHKVMSIVTVLCICGLFVVTVQAASSNYSFILDNRLVDGKANGNYHSLDKGTVYLKGSHWVYSTDPFAVGAMNKITYALFRDRVGPDVGCGSLVFENDAEFDKKIGTADTKSSKYYLQIYKVEDDGYNVTGNGSIYN